MKREAKIIDATPNKRLFWSIISDYSLSTSICELIDNALDIWLKNHKGTKLAIELYLDPYNRTIRVKDNAGGVPEEELHVLISPGSSLSNPSEDIIGMFGVGSKRAVVALAENVKIKTRHHENRTYQIDIDESWLQHDAWDIPVYQIDDIEPNTTIIDLSSLRILLNEEEIDALEVHIRETYALYLKEHNFSIHFNGKQLAPICFDNWSYPPDFEPRTYLFEVSTETRENVGVEICGGLISDRNPVAENYGVCFYCNDRLILKHLKSREVGYISGVAGIPHPDASLARVIVKFSGPAKLMPWNSTKSEIIYTHHIFRGIINILIPVVKDFSSLSRRFKGEWDTKVLRFPQGEIKYVDIEDVGRVRKSFLPELPRVRKKRIDHLKRANAEILENKPWLVGLLDSLAAQELISRQRFETKNRIALILLDSTFEIALKEYIVHTEGLNRGGRTLDKLFKQRDAVISVVKQKIDFDPNLLTRIKHFYQLRNKLIHERATVDVTNNDITNFRKAIDETLRLLFDLDL